MNSAWIIRYICLTPLLVLCDETKIPPIEESENNWIVSADFLAWFASEEIASIWSDVITTTTTSTTWELPSFNFKWDYGFRIGAGHDLNYDRWDTAFHWSWFRTDARHQIPSEEGATVGAEFDAGFLAGTSNFTSPSSMSAKWSLLYNMFDWVLGRSYLVSKDLCMHPFLGLQGGWINQSIQTKYYDLIVDVIFDTANTGNEQLKNNFWGIGPLGGVNTKWRIGDFGFNFLDFFGDLSVGTMWGTWICSDFYKDTLSHTYSVDTKNASLGALMLRGFWGIGWDVNFYGGKSHFSAKLGFETQIWLDQLRIATFQLQRLHHDLTLQGITLNCQFDF